MGRGAAIALGLVLVVASCGSSSETTVDDAASSAVPGDGASQTDGTVPATEAGPDDDGSTATGGANAAGPIRWEDLADPAGERRQALADANANAEADAAARAALQLEECPMLATASFHAGIADNVSARPALTSATNLECRWAETPFAFTVRIEPAAEVDTVDHTGRAYNIDVEPVVEAQSGPGTNAVTLTDTAFVDAGSDGFLYAYFFVLGDQAVTLRSTSLQLRDEAWRGLADAVATQLTAGAGGLQAAADAAANAPNTTETAATIEVTPCGYLGIDQVAALMDVDAAQLTVTVQSASCIWENAAGDYLDVEAISATPQPPDTYTALYPDAEDVTGRVGLLAYSSALDSIAFIDRGGDGSARWDAIRVTSNAADRTDVLAAIAGRLVLD